MVSAKDASFSLMIGISTEEWEYIPYLGLMFFQTSSQEVLQVEPITDKSNGFFCTTDATPT